MRLQRPPSSGASSRRLSRPNDAFDSQEQDECALLVDLEGAAVVDLPCSPPGSPSLPNLFDKPQAASNQKLLTKFQAKKDLEKKVHITRCEEIPLLLEAVENARRAGFEESRVDPLYSQAEDTLERLRMIEQRRRAWVRHGDREAAMRHIRPNYAAYGETR